MNDSDRRCGNCRHISRSGHCRYQGPLGGRERGPWALACAWHRGCDEDKPLAAPRQLLRRGDDMGRMLECCYPADRPERAGWTDAAARECGARLILPPPPRRRALPYTTTEET